LLAGEDNIKVTTGTPRAKPVSECNEPEERGLGTFATPLSRWHTLPPEAARLKMPPAPLPGANLLKRLPNRSF